MGLKFCTDLDICTLQGHFTHECFEFFFYSVSVCPKNTCIIAVATVFV